MTAVAQETGSAIRPFSVDVPEEALADLRGRIQATVWPERETAADTSQGVPLAMIQGLSRYWATEYDWRRCEARLKALPQFVTEIDGLDIHFIHIRSQHDDALPLIVNHGWPGSVIEQLKIIDPLVNPTAHGTSASDAFHLVIPSMPGYGFSSGRGAEARTAARAERGRVTPVGEAVARTPQPALVHPRLRSCAGLRPAQGDVRVALRSRPCHRRHNPLGGCERRAVLRRSAIHSAGLLCHGALFPSSASSRGKWQFSRPRESP